MKYDKSKFKWSDDKGVWHNATIDRPPSVMICGARMVHVSAGKDCYGFNWAGSTPGNWHAIVDMTFDEAHEWVRQDSADYWWTK